jgi:hypothetical protein
VATAKARTADVSMVLRPSGDTVWRAVGDDVVVVHLPSLISFVLDRGAAVLWQCLDGESRISDIFDDMADVFGIPLADVVDGFFPAIQVWIDNELVEEVAHATPAPR